MAEQLEPVSKPAVVPPPYTVVALVLDWEAETIVVRLRGTDGSYNTQTFTPPDGALALMQALNKANLATKSLHRRILERMVADGRLTGTISGVPV